MGMELGGDEGAIARLKELTQENKEFFKFLVAEARTNADLSATFTGKDGNKYRLKIHAAKNLIEVTPEDS